MQYAISQPFPASADVGDPNKFERHLLEVTVAVTATGNTAHLGKTVEVGKKTRVHVGAPRTCHNSRPEVVIQNSR
jgi:hypothetical protein